VRAGVRGMSGLYMNELNFVHSREANSDSHWG